MEKNATYLVDIYDSFLSSISDYTLLERTPEDIEDDLFTYFTKARRKFRKCRQRLDLMDDGAGNKYFGYVDKEKGQIDVELSGSEIDILTHLMLVEYMRPHLLATEVMKQSLSDKDFKIYSQANQIRELNLLYRLLQREAKVMMTEYTYEGMTGNA